MNNREFENGKELTAQAGFSEQFARLAHFLRREKMRSFLNDDREDAWRKRLLHMIKMHPDMKATELTAQLGRRMPAAEEVLLGLAHKGYIVYETGSSEKAVELTDLGKKEAAEFTELDGAFDVLSEEEKTTMTGYLARINAELQKKAGPDSEADDMFSGFGGMQDGAGIDRMRKLHEFFMRKMEKRGPHGSFDPRCGWGGF